VFINVPQYKFKKSPRRFSNCVAMISFQQHCVHQWDIMHALSTLQLGYHRLPAIFTVGLPASAGKANKTNSNSKTYYIHLMLDEPVLLSCDESSIATC